jgi:hypothetical protein
MHEIEQIAPIVARALARGVTAPVAAGAGGK